jgi:hypothetical protein
VPSFAVPSSFWELRNPPLQLGEGGLATELWEAHQEPAKKGEAKEEKRDPYLWLASNWAWHLFDRGICAHMRGDDSVALFSFRFLNKIVAAIEKEANNRGYKPDKSRNEERFLDFLDQLPKLLADQERRAKEGPHPPIVCLGPGVETDQAKRIASLIARLDEVSARQGGQPGGVDLKSDPIVAALIFEGDPALDPLLDCFGKDDRLTRSVHFWRDFSRDRTALAVHEAAYIAISSLMRTSEFEPKSTGDNLTKHGAELRQALADQVREHRKTHKEAPLIDRMFRVLANDEAESSQWLSAARFLVEPEEVAYAPGTTVFSGGAVRRRLKPGEKPRFKGEAFRSRKDPSLTELIVKRIGQINDVEEAAELALNLARWDQKAALPVLTDQMKRCAKTRHRAVIDLTDARLEAGDKAALDEYAEWILGVNLEGFDRHGSYVPFGPMWNHPEHPSIRAAAEWLFNDPKSPWVPLLCERKTGPNYCDTRELLQTPLLRLPGFRKVVLVELKNRSGKGEIRAWPNGRMSLDLPGIDAFSSSGGWGDPEIPKQGIEQSFRICDYVAWKVAERIGGAPRCELYWSEDKRDAACAACAEFLERFGDHVSTSWGEVEMRLPRLDKPATADQARRGEAIFSLQGQGDVRILKLAAFPLDALWVTLKDRPYEERSVDPHTGKVSTKIAYQNGGRVYQAEEVDKDGMNQRYYGFVGWNRVARVPASEIEFPPPEPDSDGPQRWVRLCKGIDAHLEPAQAKDDTDESAESRWPADSAPTFTLELWNRTGVKRPVPEMRGMKLQLFYSPETVSRLGKLVPAAASRADWIEVKPLSSPVLKFEAELPLAPAEKVAACRFEVRDFFEIKQPGFYLIRICNSEGKGESTEITLPETRFSVAPSTSAKGYVK